jgi:hypothetical protein
MAALERAPRACVIMQQDVLEILRSAKIPVNGPLCDYILQNYTPVFRVEGFAFMVRNGRAISPLNIAELAPSERAGREASQRLVWRMAGNGAAIDAIEARTIDSTSDAIMRLGQQNASATLTPIDTNGRAIGQTRAGTWPLAIKGLHAVTIEFEGKTAALPPATTVFYFKDPGGAIVGEARMSH